MMSAVLLLVSYVVRLTNNRKNITVATRCAIPVSKTCEQSELGAFVPSSATGEPSQARLSADLLCWTVAGCVLALIKDCVFYCMSTSPNAGQIKPFFLSSALLLVASCLILED